MKNLSFKIETNIIDFKIINKIKPKFLILNNVLIKKKYKTIIYIFCNNIFNIILKIFNFLKLNIFNFLIFINKKYFYFLNKIRSIFGYIIKIFIKIILEKYKINYYKKIMFLLKKSKNGLNGIFIFFFNANMLKHYYFTIKKTYINKIFFLEIILKENFLIFLEKKIDVSNFFLKNFKIINFKNFFIRNLKKFKNFNIIVSNFKEINLFKVNF